MIVGSGFPACLVCVVGGDAVVMVLGGFSKSSVFFGLKKLRNGELTTFFHPSDGLVPLLRGTCFVFPDVIIRKVFMLEKEYGLLRFVSRGDQGKYFSKYVISISRGFYVKLRYSGENYGFADGPHYLYFIFLFLRP